MKTRYICTYFNYSYLARGCALIESIRYYNPNTVIFVLAIDLKVEKYLKNKYDNLKIISLSSYLIYHKVDKSKFKDKKQFFFSITPNLCDMLLNNYDDIDILLYLDADVYVYSKLDPIYDEFNSYSIAVCSHRQNKFLKFFLNHYGKFNVGVNIFRNDEIAKKCILDWKKNCDEWYPGKPGYKLSFFSDQIFLDEWPTKFKNGFLEIKNIGVNVAPWNAINYNFKKHKKNIYVNNKRLIIYHFSSLIQIHKNVWDANSGYAFFNLNKELEKLYVEYISHIQSFGLNTEKIVQLNFKGSFIKKIFHKMFGLLLKNKILISNGKK